MKANLSRVITKKTASQITQLADRGVGIGDISADLGVRVDVIEKYLENTAASADRADQDTGGGGEPDPQTPAEALEELEGIDADDKAGLVMLATRHGIEISTRKSAENYRADLEAALTEQAEDE